MKNKRFCLMKLTEYDREHKLETWVFTNTNADSEHTLSNFMANGFRIWDSKKNRVVRTNLDVDKWLQVHQKE
ncbi:hypothetical protein AV545_04025 [Paenibacillus jamilae]|nr:hypothetical protein AV545_04025 [Paenibacillus jamilae]